MSNVVRYKIAINVELIIANGAIAKNQAILVCADKPLRTMEIIHSIRLTIGFTLLKFAEMIHKFANQLG